MRSFRQFCWVVCSVSLLATLVGCETLSSFTNALPGTESPDTTVPTPAELPRKQSVSLNLSLAKELTQNGQIPAAIAQYEKVLALEPKNQQASRALTILYEQNKQPDKAEEQYRKLAKANPKDADLLNDWGRAYYLRNNWAESEAKLRQAVKLNPQHRKAKLNLALAVGQQGRYDEALQLFHKAELTEGEAHCNLAFILWSQGRLEEAKETCREAKRRDPNCVKATDLLARLEAGERLSSTGPTPSPSTPPAGRVEAPAVQPALTTKDGRAWVPVANLPPVGAKPAR